MLRHSTAVSLLQSGVDRAAIAPCEGMDTRRFAIMPISKLPLPQKEERERGLVDVSLVVQSYAAWAIGGTKNKFGCTRTP